MNNGSSKSQSNLSIVDSLIQLSYLIQGVLGQVGTDYHLSMIQIRLLGILRDRQPSMLQLAQYLNLDKSSITGLVDRAEHRGLVERTMSTKDRRGTNVRITSAGLQLAEVAGKEIKRRIDAAIETLTETEQSQLVALATKIINASVKF